MHLVLCGTQGCGIIAPTGESQVWHDYAMGFITYADMGKYYTESALFLRMRVNVRSTTRWDVLAMHTWEIATQSPSLFVVYTVLHCKIVYV